MKLGLMSGKLPGTKQPTNTTKTNNSNNKSDLKLLNSGASKISYK